MVLKGKWVIAVALVMVVICVVFYAVLQSQTNIDSDKDVLFQLAAFNTFSMGNYSGYMTYGELVKHGDFGIGTFEGLDGEMIALDGVFYKIPADGKPIQATLDMKAPYATVTFFEVDISRTVGGINYADLNTFIDGVMPSKNSIYAIKVSGTFEYAQTRSPQKQNQPYPELTDALKDQSLFNLNNVSATAVGFWFPSSMDGVDYAGYHLHLITDDKTAGGHLLNFMIDNATVELDEIKKYTLVLP